MHPRGAARRAFRQVPGATVILGEGFRVPLPRPCRCASELSGLASPSAVGSVSRASGRNAAHTRAPHWRANRINMRVDAYTHAVGAGGRVSDEKRSYLLQGTVSRGPQAV